MATEEDGGGIVTLPPGGGGSKLRPPVPAVLGLEVPPFLVVMFSSILDPDYKVAAGIGHCLYGNTRILFYWCLSKEFP